MVDPAGKSGNSAEGAHAVSTADGDALPTPVYKLGNTVYEPAEDTFLFMDSLQQDLPLWLSPAAEKIYIEDRTPVQSSKRKMVSPSPRGVKIILEVGVGSGVLVTFASQLVRRHQWIPLCFGTDINPAAASNAADTAQRNGVTLHVVVGSLVFPLLHQLYNRVDLLLFNPPYVPTTSIEMKRAQSLSANASTAASKRHEKEGTSGKKNEKHEDEECVDDIISAAWAGGKDGMEVTNLLLPLLPSLLSPGGRFYLLAVHENNPDNIMLQMRSLGLLGRKVKRRQARNESQHVLCFSKPL